MRTRRPPRRRSVRPRSRRGSMENIVTEVEEGKDVEEVKEVKEIKEKLQPHQGMCSCFRILAKSGFLPTRSESSIAPKKTFGARKKRASLGMTISLLPRICSSQH